MSLIRRLSLLRRSLAAALGLLLSLSLVGQQLPCLHADGGSTPVGTMPQGTPPVALSDGTADVAHGHMHAESSPAAPADTPMPATHHDPAAPGCAQLMACGLAITVASSATVHATDTSVRDARPVGPQLQFATAELEIELPPPRG